MFVSSNDTTTAISTSQTRALENVRAQMRRITEYGGARNAQTRAVLDRLETEREGWQKVADEETIRRWEHLQRLLKVPHALADEQAIREAVRRTPQHYPELRVPSSAYGRAPGGRG